MPVDPLLHVVDHAPSPASPESPSVVVILVHGSLDRAASFGRVVRRLSDLHVITYDRRGYQRSRRAGGPAGLAGDISGLLDLAADASRSGAPVVAVGHSFGGDVVVGAAIRDPDRFVSIGAFEPPMPW